MRLPSAFVSSARARAAQLSATALTVHGVRGAFVVMFLNFFSRAVFRVLAFALARHGFGGFLGLARTRAGGIGCFADDLARGGGGLVRDVRALMRQRPKILVDAADAVFDPFLLNRNHLAEIAAVN